MENKSEGGDKETMTLRREGAGSKTKERIDGRVSKFAGKGSL